MEANIKLVFCNENEFTIKKYSTFKTLERNINFEPQAVVKLRDLKVSQMLYTG